MVSDEELKSRALHRARAKLGFYIHLTVYVCVNLLLFFVWLFTRGDTSVPNASFPWFIFPLVGWGIGLIAHCLSVFGNAAGYLDRMTEREYRKLKSEQGQ
ncbi:MAG: 2TM domain-containing protein [Candidatus Bathyarchaeia archaeon]